MDQATRTLSGRYQLVEVVGRGAMGEVWAARDLRLDRMVAVKLLSAPMAFDATTRARFRDEARAAAGLRHPNVVTVYDSGEAEGTLYLVMELLPGRTLADEIAEGPLPAGRVRAIGVEVLAGLDACHRAGIVHRDVKPANVLLAADGSARLADLGIAKSVQGADLTGTGVILGSVAYLAPERLAGHPATPRSDLYAVGVVLHEALTGRKPSSIDDPPAGPRPVGEHPSRPQRQPRPGLDPALADVVERALATAPDDRFASAAEMADALQGPSRPRADPVAGAPTLAMTATVGVSPTVAVSPTEVLRAGGDEPTLDDADPTRPARSAAEPTRGSGWWRHRGIVVGAAVVGVLAVLLLTVLPRSSPPPSPDPGPGTSTATGAPLSAALDDAITKLEEAVRR